jgi:hypothetical protein
VGQPRLAERRHRRHPDGRDQRGRSAGGVRTHRRRQRLAHLARFAWRGLGLELGIARWRHAGHAGCRTERDRHAGAVCHRVRRGSVAHLADVGRRRLVGMGFARRKRYRATRRRQERERHAGGVRAPGRRNDLPCLADDPGGGVVRPLQPRRTQRSAWPRQPGRPEERRWTARDLLRRQRQPALAHLADEPGRGLVAVGSSRRQRRTVLRRGRFPAQASDGRRRRQRHAGWGHPKTSVHGRPGRCERERLEQRSQRRERWLECQQRGVLVPRRQEHAQRSRASANRARTPRATSPSAQFGDEQSRVTRAARYRASRARCRWGHTSP